MMDAGSIIFTPKRSRRYAVISLTVLIVLSCIAVLSSVASLRERMEQVRTADTDNSGWLVSQLDVDFKALMIATGDLLLAQTAPEGGGVGDLAELNIRFDVFYSRVNTVVAAFSRKDIPSDLSDKLAVLATARDTLAVGIDRINAGETEILPEFLSNLRQAAPMVRAVTTTALFYYVRKGEIAREDVGKQLRKFWILSVVIFMFMIAAAMLALRLWYDLEDGTLRMRRASGIVTKAFEASLGAVVVATMDGRILMTNAAASSVFGVPYQDLVGRTINDMMGPAYKRLARMQRHKSLRNAGTCNLVDAGPTRIGAMRPDGQAFPAEISVAADTDLDGNPILIAFIRDITHLVAAEEKLRAERTAAERNAAAKTTFLAMMSHDMRTPLQGMIAALDMLDPTALDAENRALIGTARDCSGRALQQINDVLEITRLSGRELADVPFNPKAVVEEILGELTPLARARGIALNLLVDHALPARLWSGKAAAFARAMYNLIGNAVKFTESGQVLVRLDFTDLSAEQTGLHVAVSDTGIGIAPEDQKRIFKEFEMLNETSRGSNEGTGLGLTIAHLAVRQMGGTLGLVSAPGEGSTFSFDIKLSSLSATSPTTSEAVTPSPDLSDAAVAQPCAVLVVDDNAINLALLATMVRKIGHVASCAPDGLVAVRMAAMQQFDVILMDVSMPVMDGYEATRQIRAGGPSQTAVIIAVTAFSDAECAAALRDAGVDDILTKPTTQAQIAAAMQKCWQARLSVSPPVQAATGPEDSEMQQAIATLTDLVGAPSAWRLMSEGLSEVATTLDRLGTDPAPDAAAASAIHKVVGSTGLLGFVRLSEALLCAEQAAHAGDRQTLRDALVPVRTAFDRVSAQMTSLSAAAQHQL
jgi:PAS domain S-box-containing protein